MAQKAFSVLVLLAASTLAMASTAAAQSSPQDFLDAHNAARRGEGVGLPDVVWNTTLQAFAENYVAVLAATCSLAHSNSGQLGYGGENLYMGGAGSASTAADAVGNWMEEKASYVYSSNTCTKGRLIDCGHYTQIVWRSTTSIGCARAVCSNGGATPAASSSPTIRRRRCQVPSFWPPLRRSPSHGSASQGRPLIAAARRPASRRLETGRRPCIDATTAGGGEMVEDLAPTTAACGDTVRR